MTPKIELKVPKTPNKILEFYTKIYFFAKNLIFLKKVAKVGKTPTCSFRDLFLPFFGHIPDDNRLDLIELCQNHPPYGPGVEKLSELHTHGRNGKFLLFYYFWADSGEGEKRLFPDSCCFF